MSDLNMMLREAGIVGAGGAGFPTYVKMGGQAEYLLANGAECEPLLAKDQALMSGFPELVVEGMRQAMVALGASNGLIAVKQKHEECITALNRVLSSGKIPIKVAILPDIYPAGDEVVLVYETLGRVVPPGSLPGKVGVIVDNIETLYNIALATQGQPVTEKYLTVAGWVHKPVTIRLPIGAPFAKALELAGGPIGNDFEVIVGGPMMGDKGYTPDQPVTKTTSALIVLPRNHPLVLKKSRVLSEVVKLARSVCISCSFCSETCPRRLLGHPVQPHLVMRAIGYHPLPQKNMEVEGWLRAIYEKSRFCVNCGTCDTICPMGLSPSKVMTHVKSTLPGGSEHGPVQPLASRVGRRLPTSRLLLKLGLGEYKNIHPTLQKTLSVPITRVRLLLKQGIGVPAQPVVKTGQSVKQGEPVGVPVPDKLGVSLHASISGLVTEVTAEEIIIESLEKAGS